MDDNKNIIPPGSHEHSRRPKTAWRKQIKQTLLRLLKNDDLFLNNNITHAEEERIAIAKNNTINAKRVAIYSAQHAQRDQPTIELARCGQITAYCLSSAFN
jgi:hypothetical protein